MAQLYSGNVAVFGSVHFSYKENVETIFPNIFVKTLVYAFQQVLTELLDVNDKNLTAVVLFGDHSVCETGASYQNSVPIYSS